MRFSLLLFLILNICCSKSTHKVELGGLTRSGIKIENAATKKGSYQAGEAVSFSFKLMNPTSKNVHISKLKIEIRNISKGSTLLADLTLEELIELQPEGQHNVSDLTILKIEDNLPKDAYGVFVSYINESSKKETVYSTFFRIVDKNMLTSYVVRSSVYNGLKIFALDGGMSAEYAVEKAVANLAAGISHSWDVNPVGGPNHVYATPQFLENSVNETVKIYNNALGADIPFETVIISTGFPSVPYLSSALKAPVLPLHFLTSSNTVKELQSIMDYSNQNGLHSYTTLSHDPSVPFAVAWVKLLDLPQQYKQFLLQHRVKNIIIMGSTGVSEGETKARRLSTGTAQDSQKYAPGSIYIMYPGTSANDQLTLKEKIVDIDEFNFQEFENIADWESGITQEQILNFSASIKEFDITKTVYSLTATNLLDLYDMGSYISTSFLAKNKLVPKGVTLNPYLVSQPAFEWWKGYIPLVYWQLNPPQATINRLKGNLGTALLKSFPTVNFQELTYWVNSSNNFGAAAAAIDLVSTLRSNGLSNIKINDYTKDEVWDPSNGLDAICEKEAMDILANSNEYYYWLNSLSYLNPSDLRQLAGTFPGFIFKEE